MGNFFHVLNNLDTYLNDWVNYFGIWTYLVLFAIVWAETGLIVLTAFLPGESLLFAAGTMAAVSTNKLNIIALVITFWMAALAGDSTNYLIGKTIGSRLLDTKLGKRFIKPEQIKETQEFYDKYGARAIILGRYVPFVRSFVPFIAAASDFSYWHFLRYSIIGTGIWGAGLTIIGYLFGNIPFIRNNIAFVILGIVLFTMIPTVISFYRDNKKTK